MLACGCRPADTFCKTARRLQREVQDAMGDLDLAKTTTVFTRADSKAKWIADKEQELADAERALRDHLAGEAAA